MTPIGRRIGLVSDAQDTAVQEKYRTVAQEIKRLEATGVAESEALNEMLRAQDVYKRQARDTPGSRQD